MGKDAEDSLGTFGRGNHGTGGRVTNRRSRRVSRSGKGRGQAFEREKIGFRHKKTIKKRIRGSAEDRTVVFKHARLKREAQDSKINWIPSLEQGHGQ